MKGLVFDHGAQYATARDPAFIFVMQDMAAAGKATPEWSRTHLEQPADAVQATLRNVFAAVTGITAVPCCAAVHRWRYALADAPLNKPAL